MSQALTDLGVAAIRDGFRAGQFSAREVAEAFNRAVAGARGLNAFIVETPEHALAAFGNLGKGPTYNPLTVNQELPE